MTRTRIDRLPGRELPKEQIPSPAAVGVVEVTTDGGAAVLVWRPSSSLPGSTAARLKETYRYASVREPEKAWRTSVASILAGCGAPVHGDAAGCPGCACGDCKGGKYVATMHGWLLGLPFDLNLVACALSLEEETAGDCACWVEGARGRQMLVIAGGLWRVVVMQMRERYEHHQHTDRRVGPSLEAAPCPSKGVA